VKELNWIQRNIFHIAVYWKTLLSSKRIQIMNLKMLVMPRNDEIMKNKNDEILSNVYQLWNLINHQKK